MTYEELLKIKKQLDVAYKKEIAIQHQNRRRNLRFQQSEIKKITPEERKDIGSSKPHSEAFVLVLGIKALEENRIKKLYTYKKGKKEFDSWFHQQNANSKEPIVIPENIFKCFQESSLITQALSEIRPSFWDSCKSAVQSFKTWAKSFWQPASVVTPTPPSPSRISNKSTSSTGSLSSQDSRSTGFTSFQKSALSNVSDTSTLAYDVHHTPIESESDFRKQVDAAPDKANFVNSVFENLSASQNLSTDSQATEVYHFPESHEESATSSLDNREVKAKFQ